MNYTKTKFYDSLAFENHGTAKDNSFSENHNNANEQYLAMHLRSILLQDESVEVLEQEE